ncbi:hypothetical protein acsn021_30750 [Anaerocolumna cellulosilytica]|uniref:Uncharacterized protein n=1 Tax=Anaerocolumna cellulosilytica TaxID=433286 RepID=A0A6S6R0D4_9FIRM|nr:RHS repeat-associated core domain-containing protein [Anaerocolumna cellulosilytica]MBB5198155.1 RHS repeat-associated protein [Anaerocolumna cellulosilytica]BCJ95506.1 hypothetical protein acsn021_30750 [Anaerocolumna cellulosilytica]
MVFNPSNSMQESGLLSNKEGKESLLQSSRYEYDGFNKTRKVTVEYFGNEKETPTAVQIQENFYDAENLRYGIAENGERTNFITNGWKVLAEQDESNQTTNRIVLGYGIIASDSLKQEGNAYQYFHWNEHGDTEYITGEDGQVLNRYGYDAFGSLTTAEEIVRNRYTYNGEQYDAITSQYYLRARFYNPQVARFTQEDVYRGDGLNLYAYCANNPVMYEDTSGYNAQSKCPKPGEPEGQKKQTEESKPKIDYRKVADYVKDLEEQTGIKLNKKQIKELKNALRKKAYSKLTPQETLAHRKEFNKVKNDLIAQWEKETGQVWPTYTQIVYDKNGKPARNIGDFYDAHHVIENNYGGDHSWWNITPAKFPDEHQGGIHRSQSPARKLFN